MYNPEKLATESAQG